MSNGDAIQVRAIRHRMRRTSPLLSRMAADLGESASAGSQSASVDSNASPAIALAQHRVLNLSVKHRGFPHQTIG